MPNCDWGRECHCSDCVKRCEACGGIANRGYIVHDEKTGYPNYYCSEDWTQERKAQEEAFQQRREQQRLAVCCQCSKPSTVQYLAWSKSRWMAGVFDPNNHTVDLAYKEPTRNCHDAYWYTEKLQGFCDACASAYLAQKQKREEEHKQWVVEYEKARQRWQEEDDMYEQEREKEERMKMELQRKKKEAERARLAHIQKKLKTLHASVEPLQLVPFQEDLPISLSSSTDTSSPSSFSSSTTTLHGDSRRTRRRTKSSLPYIDESLLAFQKVGGRWTCCKRRLQLFYALELQHHYAIPNPRKGRQRQAREQRRQEREEELKRQEAYKEGIGWVVNIDFNCFSNLDLRKNMESPTLASNKL